MVYNPDKIRADEMIGDDKLLAPGMAAGPLISGMLETGNPASRLVTVEESLPSSLKIVYFKDENQARSASGAIDECLLFAIDPRTCKIDPKTGRPDLSTGKPDPRIIQRIEGIKNLISTFCSVGGRFAHGYMQMGSGVLTTTYSDKGWKPLSMPQGRDNRERPPSTYEKNDKGKRP